MGSKEYGIFPHIAHLAANDGVFQGTHIMLVAISLCCEVFGFRGFQTGAPFSGTLFLLGSLSTLAGLCIVAMLCFELYLEDVPSSGKPRHWAFRWILTVGQLYSSIVVTVMVFSAALMFGMLFWPPSSLSKLVLGYLFVILQASLLAFAGIQIKQFDDMVSDALEYVSQEEELESSSNSARMGSTTYGSVFVNQSKPYRPLMSMMESKRLMTWPEEEEEEEKYCTSPIDSFHTQQYTSSTNTKENDEPSSSREVEKMKDTQPEDENHVRQQYKSLFEKYGVLQV